MSTGTNLFLLNPSVLDDLQILKVLIEIQLLFLIMGAGNELLNAITASAQQVGLQNGELAA